MTGGIVVRAGILTFPNSPSHGASLQMYALSSVIRGMGIETEIVNFCSQNAIHKRAEAPGSRNITAIAKQIVGNAAVKKQRANFDKFESQLCKYPPEEMHTTEELIKSTSRYDRIIVGSDQVWNPHITGDDENYMLAFSNSRAQKAAYAPSFGVDRIDEKRLERVAELLNGFSLLSAREKQGAKIIKELTGREVPVVLDPTLLVDKEHWQAIASNHPVTKGAYVLLYAIKPSASMNAFAELLAQHEHLPLITEGGRLRDKLNPWKHPVFGAGPLELLGLICGATYVVTNSFHGMALSINLQKNFYVQFSSDTNSRLTNMVDMFGLDDCVIRDPAHIRKPVEIDYDLVGEILKTERNASIQYLQSIFA